MVTIKDVARRAGVSVTTVSRVLNNTPHPVSPETRQKVLEAVAELGFCPNAAARSLQLHETRTIGLMLPDVANPYYSGIVRGIEDVAHEEGYTIVLCNTDRSRERTLKYLRVLREKRVDGVIFMGGGIAEDAKEDRFFQQEDIPTVVIGRHSGAFPSVQIDNAEAARQAVMHLLTRGYRYIGCIAGPSSSTTVQDRLAGYRRALVENGLEYEPSWVVHADFTPAGGYRAAQELLERQPRPTALLVHNDLMAVGAIKALADRGLVIPRDVAVIGFDDIPLASYVTPGLTTVRIPVYELGATAMRLLRDLLVGQPVPEVTILPVDLVVRGST
ncbi:transcriptional regulator, LacI family [Thermanaeromonas toyohensis ToBE]|uniref:Transcriptional regulator, LacI family n=1 Tax=Thermanaeromonas toyohensis ToBE TaxID=698762 RepID=A0A1W1VC45_9FIRM|nr:LacI family DNA-binding transcriptional regulator [Thermanaeromonas toyohensis]SMB90544.1 transcriptional regulator, LacI family [Thermanaeromonas toyohensis ToBE]